LNNIQHNPSVPNVHPITMVAVQDCISYDAMFLTYLHSENEDVIYLVRKQDYNKFLNFTLSNMVILTSLPTLEMTH